MSKTPKYDLVLVSWIDHVEHTGWQLTKDIRRDAEGGHLIWSVGWLIESDEVSILVAPHVGIEPMEEATGTMEIFTEAIQSIQIINFT